MRSEAPFHGEALAALLGEVVVRLHIDALTVHASPALTLCPPHGSADVTVRTDLRCLQDLVRGELTLRAALADRRLDVFGARPALSHAAHAFRIFASGLVRAPTAPDLSAALDLLVRQRQGEMK
ncbi:MAG: hypothetical protein R3B72_32105 [Polyangiaceae bacterium]